MKAPTRSRGRDDQSQGHRVSPPSAIGSREASRGGPSPSGTNTTSPLRPPELHHSRGSRRRVGGEVPQHVSVPSSRQQTSWPSGAAQAGTTAPSCAPAYARWGLVPITHYGQPLWDERASRDWSVRLIFAGLPDSDRFVPHRVRTEPNGGHMRLRTITIALATLALPLTAAVPASSGAATAAETITARDLLARVTVAAEAGSSTYDRAKLNTGPTPTVTPATHARRS